MANNPFPLVIGASTASLMSNFDTDVYNTSPSSLMYKIVDALCGSTGAGALLNRNFLNLLQNSLDTTYGSDLDYFFGNIGFVPRAPSEMYPYNTSTDLLTSAQWDEVRIKDAWYRERIKDFWTGCNMGGTPEAIRMICLAAVSVDCNVYEVWRYLDNYGLTGELGRAGTRNEVVIQPLKTSLSPQEFKLLRDMLDRVMPIDTVVTVNTQGLTTQTPVPVAAACANSTYFEIQKQVIATPVISQLPPPDQLPIDLLPTEQWLFDAINNPQLAPYAQFNISAQCFSAETRVITERGVFPISELSGGTHRVLTSAEGGRGGGIWTDAKFRGYGKQRLMKITLRRSGVEKEIYATAGHRWFVTTPNGTGSRRTETITCALRPGQRLSYCHARRNPNVCPSPVGIAHHKSFKVVSVEDTDRYEEVFCAEVPRTGSFTLEDNILTGNCGYYYLVGGGTRSPIDSVTYSTLNADGTTTSAQNFLAYQTNSQYTPWTAWPKADSPDNYPGGKFGIHPSYAPALNYDGTPYNFPWPSQTGYVDAQINIITGLGGNANQQQYQLPIQAPTQTSLAFLPQYAIAYFPPGRDSTVSASLTRNRQVQESGTQGWTSTAGFVRS